MAQRFLARLTAATRFATPQPNIPELTHHVEIDICGIPFYPWYQAPEPPLRSNFFNGGAGFLVSYPSDSVEAWVVKFPPGRGRRSHAPGDNKDDEPARRARWNERMGMVLSMREKCEAVEDLGGAFY
jgi:hypothetical protein